MGTKSGPVLREAQKIYLTCKELARPNPKVSVKTLLIDFFVPCIRLSEKPIFIIVDGINEPKQDGRKEICEFLLHMHQQLPTISKPRVRVLLTSQPIPELTGQKIPTIELTGEKNLDSIKTAVTNKTKGDTDLRGQIDALFGPSRLLRM